MKNSYHFFDTVRRAMRAESWTLEGREAEACRSWKQWSLEVAWTPLTMSLHFPIL